MHVWKHGRYVDTWSVVHLLSGMLLGSGLYKLGYGLVWAGLFALFAMLLWELFEWVVKISESLPNIALDIVIGLLGFLLAFCLHAYGGVPFDLASFTALASVTALLALWGFTTSLGRGVLE